MLDHAFGTLSLHRIGLSVFSFNERAIRSYQSCGFVIEGRAREAIWRDGRWWDEITMSVLDSDWVAMQPPEAAAPAAGKAGKPAARASVRRIPAAGFLVAPPMSSTGPAADAARADFRELMEAKGHAVDNARAAVDRLEAAFAAGDLVRTPTLDLELGDLMRALEQDEGQKLGGKSAEAARFILQAIDRELANA